MLAVIALVPLPYFVVSPGPATDVLPLIEVEEHPVYPTDGRFLLTTVYVNRATAFEALRGWADSSQQVRPEDEVLAPGETDAESRRKARSQMDTSKIDAAVVVLTDLVGYPDRHGAGVLVENVLPGTPAEGSLFAGDVIVAVDGEAVDDPEELGRLVRAAGVGVEVTLTVEAGGQREEVKLAPARLPNVDHHVIGVTAVRNFPFPLLIRSGDVGGPSAGLMWALGLTELLTRGELAGGMVVAGTGTIAVDGSIGPVGGVEEKVLAAQRAGADVFFVPAENEQAANAVAEGMRLVSVSTFRDAVEYLQSLR
jgi:Lon-like protease